MKLREVMDTLDRLGIEPKSVRAEWHPAHHVTMWLGSRTDMFAFCADVGLQVEEGAFPHVGQRVFSAHTGRDLQGTPLLVQDASFEHQDDWEPRAEPTDSEAGR